MSRSSGGDVAKVEAMIVANVCFPDPNCRVGSDRAM